MGDFYITWGIIIYYGGFLHNMGDCYIMNERFHIRMLNLLLKRFLIRMLEKPYYDICEVPYKDAQLILKRFLIRMLEKPYYDI